MVKNKKVEYRKSVLENMDVSKKNQKLFWKLLGKLEDKSEDIMKKIYRGNGGSNTLSVFCSTRIELTNIHPQEIGPLDHKIDLKEMIEASYILKCNKTTGYDSLS